MTIFPKEMLSQGELSLESIASRFSYFFEELHLLHLQTPSHSEHSALNLWEDVVSAKDNFLEEIMGYEGRKLKAYTIDTLRDYSPGMPSMVVNDLKGFSKQLESYAISKGYSNIGSLAQELGGKCAKTLYLLTQS